MYAADIWPKELVHASIKEWWWHYMQLAIKGENKIMASYQPVLVNPSSLFLHSSFLLSYPPPPPPLFPPPLPSSTPHASSIHRLTPG